MEVFPAIDVRGGRAVRLLRGDFARETVYDEDPVARAVEFERQGARWIHVVDLDAARSGRPENRDVVAAIASSVDVPIQAGGGVRDEEAADALVAAGVSRLVVGTAALEQPALLRRLAGRYRVAAGVDARLGVVATRGWERGSGRRVAELLPEVVDAGVEAVVLTAIQQDGTLAGPDVGGLEAALGAIECDLIASGGVADLDDLRVLAALRAGGRRIEGAVVGRALYEEAFTLADALAAAS